MQKFFFLLFAGLVIFNVKQFCRPARNLMPIPTLYRVYRQTLVLVIVYPMLYCVKYRTTGSIL